MGLRSEQTLRDLLAGGNGLVCGITYVPSECLATALRTSEDEALVAACSLMELDFAFVTADSVDAASKSRAITGIGVAPFWSVPGPLGLVAERFGWRKVLMETIGDPRALGAALDEATNEVCERLEEATAAGAFALVVADDLAGRDGLMLSPDWVIDELSPRLAQIASYAEDRGVTPVFHSDGDIRTVLKAIRRAGFVALHSGGSGWTGFEQLYSAARAVDLAVIGGLEGEDLRGGEVASIAAGTRAAVLASGSGLLAADDGGLTTVKEVDALVTALGATRGADAAEADR
jgi:hypothetical protein